VVGFGVTRPRIPPRYRCEVCGAPFRGKADNANRFCGRVCARFRKHAPEVVAAVRALWEGPLPTREIARRTGLPSRWAVNALAKRQDWPSRAAAP
jgi:hypothetical protein